MSAAAKKELVQVHPLRDAGNLPVRVEMAPGEHIVVLPPDKVPRVAVAEWQPAGDGTYRLVARRREFYVPIKEAARLAGVPYQTMLRLHRGGFIDGDRPAPNSIRVSLSSWFEHQERVRRDPEFWNAKNLQRFRETL